MSKTASTKSKPVPWVPPGPRICKNQKPSKPASKSEKDDLTLKNNLTFTLVSPKTTPKKTVAIPKEIPKVDEPGVMSLSSHSSYGSENEPDVRLISLYEEMKIIYVHFETLKSSYLSAHRLIGSQEIEDSYVTELLVEAGACINELNICFNDLEYSISVLENTLDENQKTREYSAVMGNKQKLLSKLFNLYEKVIIIFQSVFEKQDLKELSQAQDSLNKKLKFTEKKNISQEAIIKDLERKLSIYQSKTNDMESYKTNLECANAELGKQLLHKENQIKHLSNELLDASGKERTFDHEKFIEILECVKSEAHAEKSALKKALKFQNAQSRKHKEEYQKLVHELNEKEKMVFEIAAQRDQLKVQLTVVNNNMVDQRNQMEELRIQNQKLQNEMTEKDASHKKTMTDLQNTLEEKLSELDRFKTKSKLETRIEELEEAEFQKSKRHFKNAKDDENQTFSNEEIQHLVSLLQNTKEVFENFRQSSHIISGMGDQVTNNSEFGSVQNEILFAVKEIKEHLLQLKSMYESFLQVQKGSPEHRNRSRNNDLEKQLKKLEQLYNAAKKENMELQQEIEELKSSTVASPTVQKTENHFATYMPSDNSARKLQLELMKKNDEIVRMKYNFKQMERDLEEKLKEYKTKLRTLEVDREKISSLEEELKRTKQDFSFYQNKKEKDIEELLQRTKDLQDSLDLKNSECECLQGYVKTLKSSYYNVFGS